MKKIIIIGAGILGATTAYKLAKSGLEVTIIDRSDQGQATSAAAGIICPWLSQRRNKAWYELAKGGAAIYPELIAELQKDGAKNTGYSRVGAISIHTDEDKLETIQKRASKRREDAPEIGEITMLNVKETKKLFPPIKDGYRSLHISGAARVDGKAMRNALLCGAETYGATIIKGNAALVQKGATITGVEVDEKFISADQVIATSGAWMNELFKPIRITFKGTFQKGQLLHLQVEKQASMNWPVVMPPSDQSIVPFDDFIVIGATHEDHVETGYDYRVTAGGVSEILTKALSFAPGLSDYSIAEARVGFRPFTPGFLPIIGEIPGLKGLLLANGLGASGLTTGPFVGIQLAKLALEQELNIDVANYNPAAAIEM